MCGIVGAVAQRDIAEILIEGLRRLEYRGYDSAGLAVVDNDCHMTRLREVGKVQMLAEEAEKHKLLVVQVLPIPVGQPMVNLVKIMLILMSQALLPWYIMVLLKTIKS